MPRVPVYSQPSETPAAVPGASLGVQASPAAFGGAMARGVDNVAAVAANEIALRRQRGDQVALLDAERRLGERQNALEAKLAERRGQAAMGAHDELIAEYDQTAGEIEAQLGNDDQRLAFRNLADGRRIGLSSAAQNHIRRELRQVEDQAFEGAQAVSLDAAHANYADPGRVEGEAGAMARRIDEYAQRNGLPPEWAEHQKLRDVSAAYAGAIERMLVDGDDRAAAAAYERWKGNLSGADQAGLSKALETASTRAEAQRQADDILMTTADRAEAMARVAKIQDPKLRDEVDDRVHRLYGLREQARREDQAKLYDTAAKKLVETAGDLSAIDPVAWSRLDIGEQDSLRKRAALIAEGKQIPDRSPAYWRLRTAYAQGGETREAFKADNLRRYQGDLSPGDYIELLKLQEDALNNESKLGAVAAGIEAEVQALYALATGKDPKTRYKDGKAISNPDADAFRAMVYPAIAAEQRVKGRELTPEEARTVAERALAKKVVATGDVTFWSKVDDALPFGFLLEDRPESEEMRAYQIPGMVAHVDQIPVEKLAEVVAEARRNGVANPKPEHLVDRYNQKLIEGMRGK